MDILTSIRSEDVDVKVEVKNVDVGAKAKATEDAIASKKPYSRPSYGKGQVNQVWENAKDPITEKFYDPTGVDKIWNKSKPRSGKWDMGHIPEEKYSDMHELYMNGTITKKEFLVGIENLQTIDQNYLVLTEFISLNEGMIEEMDINKTDYWTIIKFGSLELFLEKLRIEKECIEEVVNSIDKNGISLLGKSLISRNFDIANFLLGNNANVNII